jgi:hypothetical protein
MLMGLREGAEIETETAMSRPLSYTALAATTALTLATGRARGEPTPIVTVVQDVKACDNYVDVPDGKTCTHPFKSGQPVYLLEQRGEDGPHLACISGICKESAFGCSRAGPST